MVEYEKNTSEMEKKPINSNKWQKNKSVISNKITIFSSATATFINFQNHLSKSQWQGQAMHYFSRKQLFQNEIIGFTFKIALCKAHSLSVTHIKKIKIASNVPTIVNPNFTWDNLRCTDIGPEKVTILNWTELQAFLTDFWTIFDRCFRRSITVGNMANLKNNAQND